MRRLAKRLAGLAVAAAVAALPAAAGAAEAGLPLGAFFGTFAGGGVAESRDSIYFAVTARDFDVAIAPADGGFRISWTSVIRSGGDPARPRVRRKKSTRTLRATGVAGMYRGSDSGDPLDGKELFWARLHGNTLSVYLMTVDRTGVYELQQYDRTLSGTGMKLVFKSYRDGDELRTVTGRLVKTAN